MAENKDAAALPPPKLTVSRALAAQKIRAQIENGKAIRDMVIDSEVDLSRAGPKQSNWRNSIIELLSWLFDNSSISEKYSKIYIRSSDSYVSTNFFFGSRVNWFHEDMDKLISHVESVLERLDFIPEPTPEPVQANIPSAPSTQNLPLSREVFIVHGHDEAAREAVARALSQLDLKPIILNEKADAGLTVIEKFEKHANVAFAVVLLTPDDIGCAKKEPDQQKPRARQNVILEFGYFLGRLGRGKVCALYKEGVELPSDLYGILYVSMDASGAWKFRLAKEISQAGIKVDINALLAD